ncbi:MAG: hypothetical protein IKH56_08705 [Oscillospiraceae bacterium]|nr:hypothetical protein [Oscillospiraceae bacterium]
MALFQRKEPTTPSGKARQSLLGMIARLGCCAYLIYTVVTLFRQSSADTGGVPQPIAIILAVVMGVAALFFSAITLKRFFIGLKNEDYSMHKYYAEDLAKLGLRMNEFGEYVPIEAPEDEGADEEVEPAQEEGSDAEQDEEFPSEEEPAEEEPEEEDLGETE